MYIPKRFLLALAILAGLVLAVGYGSAHSQSDSRYFPETKHSVRGKFLQYWNDHGGLAQQGYPLTEEFQEKNKLNGQTYTVQYFERAVFELHPENQAPYDVLLSQLGKFELESRYPNGSNPAAAPVEPGGNPAPTATPQPAQPTATPAPAQPAIVGQVIEIRGGTGKSQLQLTVTGAEEKTSLPGGSSGPVNAEGKFVVLLVTLKNIGQAPDVVGLFNPDLKDSQGRSFSLANFDAQAAAASAYGRKDYFTTVQPGLSTEIVLVYDVAPDATGYMLVPSS